VGKLNVKCFTCLAKEICKYKDDYEQGIHNLEDVLLKPDITIRNTQWLDIELHCRFYMNIHGDYDKKSSN